MCVWWRPEVGARGGGGGGTLFLRLLLLLLLNVPFHITNEHGSLGVKYQVAIPFRNASHSLTLLVTLSVS